MITVTTKDNTPELMQKLQAATGRFVRKGAAYLEQQLKLGAQEEKSGNLYKRGKSAVHQASAPGESPANDSSNLYPSIIAIIAANSLEATIGTPVEHALYLEEGTDNIEPRPLWEKTAADSLPTLEKMLKAEVRRG